ncbi:UNVERIFIED_CONTAM: Sphingoid long-chain bases kinase [Sesamum radiatum]|uniref:Sphingoid long-chain bases kinase n=1 Tax=Sesamum radiatum TaxID=300843 RepID=A0AAW2VJR5_SESRA
MQKSRNISKNSSFRQATQQSLRRLGLCSPITTGQQTSPVIFPEKRNSRGKPETHGDISVTNDDLKKAKVEEHRIDIGDEQCDLLGYEVFSGKLSLDKRKSSEAL